MADSDSSSRRMVKTRTPGIYKRGDRYVVVGGTGGSSTRRRTGPTTRPGRRGTQGGRRRPTARATSGSTSRVDRDLAGRTERGFSETTRPEYARPIEAHALPRWGTWKLAEIEPPTCAGYSEHAGRASPRRRSRSCAPPSRRCSLPPSRTGCSAPTRSRAFASPSAAEAGARTRERQGAHARGAATAAGRDPEDWRLFFEFLAAHRPADRRGDRAALGAPGPGRAIRTSRSASRSTKGERKRLKSKQPAGHAAVAGMAERLLAHRRDTYGGTETPGVRDQEGDRAATRATSTAGCWRQRGQRRARRSRSRAGRQAGASARRSASTPSATPARRCCSTAVATSSRCRSGWATPNPVSRSNLRAPMDAGSARASIWTLGQHRGNRRSASRCKSGRGQITGESL